MQTGGTVSKLLLVASFVVVMWRAGSVVCEVVNRWFQILQLCPHRLTDIAYNSTAETVQAIQFSSCIWQYHTTLVGWAPCYRNDFDLRVTLAAD